MSERNYGILGTIIIHNIVILILLFSYLGLPKPALNEGSILINFGDVPYAGGQNEPRLNNVPQQQNAVAGKPEDAASKDEGYMTQENEDAPAINTSTQKKKQEVKTKPTVTITTKKTIPQKSPEPVQQVNTKALYTGKGKSTTESGTSQGVYTGQGNMGNPDGTPESGNYSGGLGGPGISANLNGRNPVYLQKPDFEVVKEGIVVVEITVGRDGRVIGANPGAKGSTIVDNTLYAAAKKAALESKFNVKSDAPDKQIGTITYHFKLE